MTSRLTVSHLSVYSILRDDSCSLKIIGLSGTPKISISHVITFLTQFFFESVFYIWTLKCKVEQNVFLSSWYSRYIDCQIIELSFSWKDPKGHIMKKSHWKISLWNFFTKILFHLQMIKWHFKILKKKK